MNQVASTAEISFASASSEGGGSEVFDMVEQKDGELARLQLKEERRLKESSQKVDALISALRVQRAACQHLDDQLTRRMQDVQEGIGNATRNCRQQRYALAVKMQQLIDEHVAEVGGCQKEEDAIYKESEAYTAEIRNLTWVSSAMRSVTCTKTSTRTGRSERIRGRTSRRPSCRSFLRSGRPSLLSSAFAWSRGTLFWSSLGR
eukprot:TRINITY_DN9513_c0_g1_i2.p1 TRINITY_DN9513_c0_g1~~TRINITY_DN9513_c0_g1_i2.p1  ORF type:complete len:204 (+),score=41.26 TRINITY_DN9513_c0_g1_i2:119-730(+)